MSSLLEVGITGLQAAQMGLTTTGQNITNASTPGFHRQQIVQSANVPLSTGSGFLGQGTNVQTVKRAYSQYLDNQVQSAQTQSSYLDAYSSQISQIDNMLADPTVGLSPALQTFFTGVSDVAANPSSVPSRQSMLSDAQAMVTSFQTLNQRLVDMRTGVNSQVTSSVAQINAYAQQLASLNQNIVLAQASANGQPANDLLDQRDNLVSQLNQLVNVSVVKQSDGSYNLFIGQGQALVVGQQAFGLVAQPEAQNPAEMGVAYQSNGGTVPISDSSLNGGSLGGLLSFRSQTLDPAQNQLGLVAIGLAQNFNDQSRLGQDLNGNLGSYFFNVRGTNGISGANPTPAANVVADTNNAVLTPAGSPTVLLSNVSNVTSSDYTLSYSAAGYTLTRQSDNTTLFANVAAAPGTVLPGMPVDGLTITAPTAAPAAGDQWLIQPSFDGAQDIGVAITDTSKIAAAAPIATAAATTNTGSATISAGTVNAPPPTNANLQDNVTISFINPTHFSVTDNTTATVLAANVVYNPAAGATLSYNGWTAQIQGAPATADSFTVGPNTGGVSDNRNALLLAGLQTQNTLVGGTATYQSTYSQMVSSVGVTASEINVASQAQTTLVTQTTQTQQSLSGVNLDEEAANLLSYQQAYQASGKMMQIASTLFDTLLNLGQ